MSDETLFHLALEKPTAERAAFLEQACGGDEARRRRLEDLLRSHETPDSFLVNSGVNPEPTSDSDPSQIDNVGRPVKSDVESNGRTLPKDGPGSFIGPYKLLQPIGEGGMGTVYMAEQRAPVHRMVALKLIKAGMDSRQVLARFGAERQALALMDHPNIAKVFDAGTTEQSLPYFVMELVKGIPITRYCDEHRLTTRERLELAIPVCQAVQHAHQKGIIHRDIKPSNVLIALYDGQPVPKIIDFGVAKATGPRLTDETLYTEFGAVVGTLEYMSPEQAQLNQLDIDTRSDIYSLGVLLYELLTGSTPLERKRLKQGAILEMLRVIREEESPRPSKRLSTIEELPSIAACRHIEPRKLSALMRGELDWIVMKALEKDRNRRYETANGLAADLRRYLNDEAVQACPPTATYRMSKFVRKYRVALATACAFIAVLVAATVISVWQAVRADRARSEAVMAYSSEATQRREAQNQRDRAFKAEEDAKANLARARSAVDDYLTTISESRLLKSPLPGLQPLRKELLTTALKYYEDFVSQNRDDPGLQADLAAATFRVADITDQIGSKDEALKSFQTALDMYGALAGSTPSPSNRSYRLGQGRCLVRMAMIQANQGQSDAAHNSFERSIAVLAQLNVDEPGDAMSRADLAFAHHYSARALQEKGSQESALRHLRTAIHLRESIVEEFPKQLSYRIDLALSLSNLGYLLLRNGQPAEALNSVRGANAIQRILVKEHPEDPQLRCTLALSTRGLASTLKTLGRWRESKPLFLESVEIMDRVVAENPAVTEFRRVLATSATELAENLIDHDEIDAGVSALAKARDQAATVQRTNPNDFRNLNALASIHRGIGKTRAKQGKITDALESLRQAISIGERIAIEDGLFTYDLACGLALYGEVVGRVQPGPGEDSNGSSRLYSNKSMKVLQQAIDRGFREADWIERDPDLRSLHSRADFQTLIKTLRQKPQTPPTGR
jgi:serine/threonine protein kinase/tetratricopeptide (TPR) repeat protein